MLENLLSDIAKVDGELETLKELAIELGASPTNLHLANVVRVIQKGVKEKLEADERAKAAGYKSTLIAIKALGQKSTFENVPTELTVAPSQWIVPRSISEVRTGSKTLTRTNPAVTATQAQTKLKKLLPLIEEFCSDNNEEGIESLKTAFYSLSYEDFSSQLLALIAEIRGRAEGLDKTEDKTNGLEPLGLPVGELILSYQTWTEIWAKDNSDYQRLIKETKSPMRLDLVEEAAAIDLLRDNENAEVASLLIPTAFFELCGISLQEVTGYEMNHADELPTRGKDFLHRLRKIGLGASIKDYQEAFGSMRS